MTTLRRDLDAIKARLNISPEELQVYHQRRQAEILANAQDVSPLAPINHTINNGESAVQHAYDPHDTLPRPPTPIEVAFGAAPGTPVGTLMNPVKPTAFTGVDPRFPQPRRR